MVCICVYLQAKHFLRNLFNGPRYIYMEGKNTFFKRRRSGSLPLIKTLEFLCRFENHKNKSDLGIFSKVSKLPKFLGQSLTVRPHYVRVTNSIQKSSHIALVYLTKNPVKIFLFFQQFYYQGFGLFFGKYSLLYKCLLLKRYETKIRHHMVCHSELNLLTALAKKNKCLLKLA